jgi:hypothetical protein
MGAEWVDFMDDMDTEKTHLRGCVHSVHYLDKSNWLRLPNLGSVVAASPRPASSKLKPVPLCTCRGWLDSGGGFGKAAPTLR